MWCLTLATNAIVCWSTEYHGLAVGALRRDSRIVDDEVLAHIWPIHHAPPTVRDVVSRTPARRSPCPIWNSRVAIRATETTPGLRLHLRPLSISKPVHQRAQRRKHRED
jgi:hypothetical protein